MRLTIVLAAAAGLAATAGGSNAQDVATTTADWGGFYAGIYAGYGIDRAAETSTSSSASQPDGDYIFDYSMQTAGTAIGTLLGDVRAGYNFQHGSLVLGLEASAGAGVLEKSVSFDYELEVTDEEEPEDSFNLDLGMQKTFSAGAIGTFTGQVGFAFGDWLVYGKGGLAVTHGTTTLTSGGSYTDGEEAPVPLEANSQASGVLFGTTFAVGAQTKLSEQMSIGAELGVVSFREQEVPVTGVNLGLPITPIGVSSIPDIGAVSIYTAKVGVNYHF